MHLSHQLVNQYMMIGFPLSAESVTVLEVNGLFRVKSGAGNSGGKPSAHAVSAARIISKYKDLPALTFVRSLFC